MGTYKVTNGETDDTAMILAHFGVYDVGELMLASTVGNVVQALIVGSSMQMVWHFFYQPKRDTRLARIGVIWITLVCIVHLAMCIAQNLLIIRHSSDFYSHVFSDWFFTQIVILIYSLVTFPVLLFFTRRAYIIWDRSHLVLVSCLILVIPTFVLGVVFAIYGMYHPWSFGKLDRSEVIYWGPTLMKRAIRARPILMASVCTQLVASVLLCVLICYGLLRHRNGFRAMDDAISKIVFLCGESLLPVVALSIIFIVGIALQMYTDYRGFHGFLIIKVCSQISPGIYLHALMDSLVSRERVQNILKAEPIRNLAELTPSQEKALETPIPVLHSNQNHLDSKFSQPSSFPKPELRWVLGINDHSHSHSPPPSSSSSSSPVGTLMNPPPTSNNLDKPTNKDVNSIIDQNHLPNVDIPWAGTYKEDDLQCLNFENIKGERERDTFPTSSTEIRRSSTGLELRRVSQIYKCKGKDLEKGIGIGKEEGTIESGMVGLEDWDRSRRSSYLYALNDALARGPLPSFP